MAEFKDDTLSVADPEMYALLEQEKSRQFNGLELIASENFTSKAVMECLGSCFTNKYSEGLPGKRYYGGNQFIDQVETMCIDRALQAYSLDAKEWGVNVQPYSGSPANFAAFTAVLKPHDRIMGLDLPSGGHLTHGYYTAKKKISATSIYFESFPYSVDPKTGIIDYDQMEERALVFRPKVLICGGSAYPREWDYARIRAIADKVGAMMMCDMAHISGLVATKCADDPFKYADFITTTTHKSLAGPRSGMIFYKKSIPDLENNINFAVFPSLQGGPHNNAIAGVATQLKVVCSDRFHQYSQQVVKNAKSMAKTMIEKGFTLATGGTDNHLILWDLRPQGITGNKFELLSDECSVTVNKNAINGDTSAFSPGGVRIGSPALTSRGMNESDMVQVAGFLARVVEACLAVQTAAGSKKMSEFTNTMKTNPECLALIAAIRKDVEAFATQFPMPGVELPPKA